MEAPTVNTPHALSASALTTTLPSPASAMTTMKRIATAVTSPRTGPSSSRGDLGEGAAIPPGARGENDEIVDRAAEDDPEQDPEVTGEEAELGGQHGPDERPSPGDRREMMAKEDDSVGRMKVLTVVQAMVRGYPRVIQAEDAGG